MRRQRRPQRVSNCLSPFSSYFTCPQGQHFRVWTWVLTALLLTQGAAKLKTLTRLMPRSLGDWTALRMIKAGDWDASALLDKMAMAALLTLPPPTDRTLYLIGDKTTKEKTGKKMPLAHKTRMNEFAPDVFGLDLVLLIAQWGRFRIPVACELVDPKIKGHQNILFRQMLRRFQAPAWCRRYGEMCAFTELARALQNGDLAIVGSEKFADYREQFISPDEYEASVQEYCLQTSLATERGRLIDQLRERLTETAIRVDDTFPENESLRIEDGEPVLRRLEKQAVQPQLRQVEMLLADTLAPVNILDVLADTENWLNWTRFFGPLSGHEDKLADPVARYVTAVFSYGCNLDPSQTARSLAEFDRRQR